MTTWFLSVHHPDPTASSGGGSGDDRADDPGDPGDTTPPDDADTAALFSEVDSFNEDLRAEGQWVFAGGLLPAATARTARLHSDGGGGVSLSDGPYVESKEHLGGVWVVRATAEEIDDIAVRGAAACRLDVEVRTFEHEVEEELSSLP